MEYQRGAWENSKQAGEPPAVETVSLVRTFGRTRAVDGVDLRISRGCVYGLLGPNGAGKTTVVRILATLLRPTCGEARVFGYDVVRQGDAVRNLISLTGQFASVDEDLTGTENLVMLSLLRGFTRRRAKQRSTELLEAFGLQDASGKQVKAYSGGMRRKIDIAASLVVRPELIFLDEPTTGLDPRSRSQVWGIIRSLTAAGTTVVLTTQYLDEADQLADRIAVIDQGRIIAEGTSEELKERVGAGRIHIRLASGSDRASAMKDFSRLLGAEVSPDEDPLSISAEVSDPEAAAEALRSLAQSRWHIASFSFGRPSLDEVFLSLTGAPKDIEHEQKNIPRQGA